MKKLVNHLLACALATGLYAGADVELNLSEVNANRSSADSTIVTIDESSDTDNLSNYAVATYEHHRGDNPEKAFQAYKNLFSGSPSMHAYAAFYEFLFDNNQHEVLIKHYEHNKELLDPIFKDNLNAQLMVAQSYLSIGNQAEADKLFAKLTDAHTDNEQVAYFATISLLKSQQHDKAEKILKRALANARFKQKHFIFYFLLSKLHVEKNNLKKALEAINQCLKLMPHFDRGILFRAMVLEQSGNIKDAIDGYQKFMSLAGRDESIEKNIVQLLFQTNRYEEALAYMKKMKSDKPEYQFDMALLHARAEHLAEAMVHVNQALKVKPAFPKAIVLKIELLLKQKQIRELLAFVQSTLVAHGSDPSIIQAITLVRHSLISTQTLIKLFNSALKKRYHEAVLIALADLYVEIKDTKNAHKVLTTLAKKTSDKSLKGKALYYIAHLMYAYKEHAALSGALKDAIHCEIVLPESYNLLAYCLAQNPAKLDDALKYSDKALELKPTDAAFMHTKAVILERQGKKAIAVDLIQKARTLAPNDPIILEFAQKLEKP